MNPSKEPMQPELLQRLDRDHARLARILEALETQAQRCVAGARGTDLDRLATLVDYINEYPDAVHHPLEDRIFARLGEHSLSPEERRVLADNVNQHQQLSTATANLAADIDALMATPADADGGALHSHVTAYVDLQRQHMRNENEWVFPIALRAFSEQDWEALERSEERAHDPLFEQRLSRYESLYEYAVEGR